MVLVTFTGIMSTLVVGTYPASKMKLDESVSPAIPDTEEYIQKLSLVTFAPAPLIECESKKNASDVII